MTGNKLSTTEEVRTPRQNECSDEPALLTSDTLFDESRIPSLDLDLVALTACNTGKGSAGAILTGLPGPGQELGGLVRDLIFAGSRGLAVSRWEVYAPQMLRLMDKFFGSGVVSEAVAMRRAEVGFMG